MGLQTVPFSFSPSMVFSMCVYPCLKAWSPNTVTLSIGLQNMNFGEHISACQSTISFMGECVCKFKIYIIVICICFGFANCLNIFVKWLQLLTLQFRISSPHLKAGWWGLIILQGFLIWYHQNYHEISLGSSQNFKYL